MKIAVLEDDRAIAALYDKCFESAGFASENFGTIAAFIAGLQTTRYDLLLLDWTLPDGEADTVIRWVREHIDWEIPIIVVSATGNEERIVSALWLGADDYLTKPIGVNELLARISAVYRRAGARSRQNVVELPPFEIDLTECAIRREGEVVPLTNREFDLACFLFDNLGKLVSRVQVLHKVWGIANHIDTRTIDVHVSRVRKKLKLLPENGWNLGAVYGYGYRLEKTPEG